MEILTSLLTTVVSIMFLDAHILVKSIFSHNLYLAFILIYRITQETVVKTKMACFLTEGRFLPVSANECPMDGDLEECSFVMNYNELCEADTVLPDKNTNYEMDNCGVFDIFKFTDQCKTHIYCKFLYDILNYLYIMLSKHS